MPWRKSPNGSAKQSAAYCSTVSAFMKVCCLTDVFIQFNWIHQIIIIWFRIWGVKKLIIEVPEGSITPSGLLGGHQIISGRTTPYRQHGSNPAYRNLVVHGSSYVTNWYPNVVQFSWCDIERRPGKWINGSNRGLPDLLPDKCSEKLAIKIKPDPANGTISFFGLIRSEIKST